LGPGIRGRELCLVDRSRLVVDRSNFESMDRSRRVFAPVIHAFSDYKADPKAVKRVAVDVSRLLAGVRGRRPPMKCKRVTTFAAVTLA
jgi:hypothetical protein